MESGREGDQMLNLTKSFSDGVFMLSECLSPKRPNYAYGFRKDKTALLGDFNKVNKDYKNSLRVIRYDKEKWD